MPVTITALTREHWPAAREIYAAGISTGHATFEAEPPATWEEFAAGKLAGHGHVALEESGRVLGWVAAAPVSPRPVYAGVVEHSLYVDAAARGRGIGRALLDALISSTERAGIWTIQSAVFPENTASLALHRAAGFTVVGTRQRLGRMPTGPFAGQWRDVLLVERRSTVAGR